MVMMLEPCPRCRRVEVAKQVSQFAWAELCEPCYDKSRERQRGLFRVMYDAAVNTRKRSASLRWPYVGSDYDLDQAVATASALLAGLSDGDAGSPVESMPPANVRWTDDVPVPKSAFPSAPVPAACAPAPVPAAAVEPGCWCMGSGYGGHSDSGAVCAGCNGSGDASQPYPCPACGDSGIERIYAGHGNINEEPCSLQCAATAKR